MANTKEEIKKLQEAEAPAVYGGAYDGQINEAYQKLTGRAPFQYSVNGDALYQQYRDRYTQNAKRSMKETMGHAASLTGGYGSSYAQGVGQQAYDETMRGLTDIIPQLEERAYDRYKDQGDQLLQQYQLLNQMGAAERETRNAEREWDFSQRQYADQRADAERNWDFTQQQYRDSRDDVTWNRNFTQQQYADQRADVERNWDFTQDQYRDSRADVAWNRNFQQQQYADQRADAERNWDFTQDQYRDSRADAAWNRNFQQQQYADQRADAERNWDFTQQQYADQRADVERNWDFTQDQYRDSRADAAWNRNFQEQQYRDSRDDTAWNRNFAQQEYADQRADAERNWQFQVEQYQDSKNRYDQEYRDKMRESNYNTLSSLILSTGYTANWDDLEAAGMSQAQADAMRQAWIGSNPGRAYLDGAMTAEDYFRLTGTYPPDVLAAQQAAAAAAAAAANSGGGEYGYSDASGADRLRADAQKMQSQGASKAEINSYLVQAFPSYGATAEDVKTIRSELGTTATAAKKKANTTASGKRAGNGGR